MTRHEPLQDRAATPPSRPDGDRAPFDGRTVMTPLLGQTCRDKLRLIGPFIAPCAPGASLPAPGPCRLKAGQIQKYP